jgi:1-acyl-sn-glycerol-3-phosphate acyltransferase
MKRGYALALAGMAETLAISVPTVVDALRGRVTLEACDARLARWSRRLLEQAEVQLETFGLEALGLGEGAGRANGASGAGGPRARETFVVMSNHRSVYDIPVLFQAFPRTLRMVTKTELFKIPVWGPAMRAAGFIEIDRKNRARAIASLAVARARLESGVNVWIAPEGTRSRDGTLREFKKGGFLLALETGLRILPVGLRGTEEILQSGSFDVRKGTRVEVHFGTPIDPRDYGMERRDALSAATREAIAALL